MATSMRRYMQRGVMSTHSFPSAISFSNDDTLDGALADIPLLSVGLLGFGAFTFFVVMRRINRLTIYVHLSVFIAFIASIVDLGQIIRRGADNSVVITDIDALSVIRELAFAFSIGLRFFFFWSFVAEPPRGELPPLPIPDDRRTNFITADSSNTQHSGSWERWSYLGFLLKWSLLLMILAITVLQSLWRLVPDLTRFGTVYNVDGTLQIVISSLFILKLLANTYLSPLIPRWKTIRDYLPVIITLSISMGLGIGNILCFEFSESSLGRFLQAVELYILILFVLISAFYKMPVRSSVVAELVRRRLAGPPLKVLVQSQRNDTFSAKPQSLTSPGLDDGTRNNRMSAPARGSERFSTTSKISSWLLPRRASNRGSEGGGSRPWDQDEIERGQSTNDKSSYRESFDQTPKQSRWRDPVMGDEKSMFMDIRSKGGRVPPPIVIPGVSQKRFTLPESEAPQEASVYTATIKPQTTGTTAFRISQSGTDSPVYGLEGIIRTLKPSDARALAQTGDINSTRSSGMESLLRQQQELDRSIADLRVFSPSTTGRNSRQQPVSFTSDFSLSNFPDPPFYAKGSDTDTPTTPQAKLPDTLRRPSNDGPEVGDNFVVDDISFQLVPPRMPAAGPSQPVPTMVRQSEDSVLPRGVRFDSQGTQYDVTSFIGGLTTPAGGNRQSPVVGRFERIPERERGDDQSDDETFGPQATIGALTRARVVDSRRQPEVGLLKPVNPGKLIAADDSVPSPGEPDTGAMTTIGSRMATRPPPGGSLGPPPAVRLPQPQVGLPAAPRAGRSANNRLGLEISNPMPRNSNALDERVAYERPRPAPLVVQAAGERQTEPDGMFF